MKVGITGGIGSGKTFVCNKLREWGYPIYDCDTEAKRLMVEDPVLVQSIKSLIGTDAYQGGKLNKSIVAEYLFSSTGHVARLNAIIHPVVRQDFLMWAERQTAGLIFMESAILLEAKFNDVVDAIVCISAPLSVRLQRVMQREGCSVQAVRQRISKQLPDDKVKLQSDYVIFNDGQHDLNCQLHQLIETLNSKH